MISSSRSDLFRREPSLALVPPPREFLRRYRDELSQHRERIAELRRRAWLGTLTLVYSARDAEHNDAVVLAEVIRRRLPKTRKP